MNIDLGAATDFVQSLGILLIVILLNLRCARLEREIDDLRFRR